jgi:hypothetical protein
MAKRDTDTEIWNEDWFIDLEGPYQLFWFYVKDCCDHAGFWRPNFKRFEQISGHRINQEKFLELVNSEKQRIIILDTGKWFLVHYISFHYSILNLKNRFHNSVYETFRKNVTCENTMEYGFEVKLTSNCPQLEVNKEQRTENKEQRIKNKEKEGMGEKEIQYRPLSEKLKKRVLEHTQQKIKEQHLKAWDREVRLMVERDNRTLDQISALIDECHDMEPSLSGFTWRNQILSMGKLREKWNEGKISIGMNKINKPQIGRPLYEYERNAASKYDNIG